MQENKALKNQNSKYLQERQSGSDELKSAGEYIIEIEKKLFETNKTSLELLNQLKNSELEVETLKQYIIDLKSRIAVYIPVRDDLIDKRLAEYINNFPDR